MNRTKIEWADYVLNPLIGCEHNCWYCYAKQINNRFKMIDDWNKPEYFPERLDFKSPKLPKKRNAMAEAISLDKPVVFVTSMGDTFGKWVKQQHIQMILDTCAKHPEAIFMFLTKNPEGAIGYSFPDNCVFGVTIEGDNYDIALKRKKLYDNVNCLWKFLSIEPILGNHYPRLLSTREFIIIGGMTGPKAIKPKQEWLSAADSDTIFYKNNLFKHFDKGYWKEKLSKAYKPHIYIDKLK